MSNYLGSKQPSVLILADFSDGSWYAASFAMQFLYKEESSLSILQTYQKPKFGHFMMRKLTTQLKKITLHELKRLKNKLLVKYGIDGQKINTLSVEGELNNVLHSKSLLKGSYNIVLGTYNSFSYSCNLQNNCLENLIDSTENPIFILPGEFNGKPNKKVLYVGTPNKIPPKKLLNRIVKICKKTQSDLEILFVLKNGITTVSDEVLSYYQKKLGKINFKVNKIPNDSTCTGIKNFLKDTSRDLIVIENN